MTSGIPQTHRCPRSAPLSRSSPSARRILPPCLRRSVVHRLLHHRGSLSTSLSRRLSDYQKGGTAQKLKKSAQGAPLEPIRWGTNPEIPDSSSVSGVPISYETWHQRFTNQTRIPPIHDHLFLFLERENNQRTGARIAAVDHAAAAVVKAGVAARVGAQACVAGREDVGRHRRTHGK